MGDRRRFGWKIKAVLTALLLIVVIGTAIGFYIYDEYKTYYSSDVREYETVSADQGAYRLITGKKEFLGSMYVYFTVNDVQTGELVYQCPDLYLVKELESVGWDDGGDIIVYTKTDGPVKYVHMDGVWKKEE